MYIKTSKKIYYRFKNAKKINVEVNEKKKKTLKKWENIDSLNGTILIYD